MYYLQVNTKGISEKFIARTSTSMDRQIDKILSETSLTYTENDFQGVRAFQKKINEMELGMVLTMRIQKSVVQITKATFLNERKHG